MPACHSPKNPKRINIGNAAYSVLTTFMVGVTLFLCYLTLADASKNTNILNSTYYHNCMDELQDITIRHLSHKDRTWVCYNAAIGQGHLTSTEDSTLILTHLRYNHDTPERQEIIDRYFQKQAPKVDPAGWWNPLGRNYGNIDPAKGTAE